MSLYTIVLLVIGVVAVLSWVPQRALANTLIGLFVLGAMLSTWIANLLSLAEPRR
jgi:hypothetical protein